MNRICGSVLLIAAVFAVFTGCASKQVQPSGFLPEEVYDRMVVNKRYGVLEYIPRPKELSHYESFIVKPIEIHIPEYSRDRELERKLDRFRRMLIEALDAQYTQLEHPAQNVAILRIAITEAESSKGLFNMAYSEGLSKSVAMEAEVLDSITKKRVAAVIDRQQRAEGVSFAAATKWGHLDAAFKGWTANLRGRLRDSRGQGRSR